MAFKTPLEAAIAHLISKSVIKGAADVARDLGLKSRGTVSSYVTGSTKISPGFQTKFENHYKIKLADFPVKVQIEGHAKAGSSASGNLTIVKTTEEKYIALLEKQATESESKLDMVLESLSKLTSAVGRLAGLSKEQTYEAFSFSASDNKLGKVVFREFPKGKPRGKFSKKNR